MPNVPLDYSISEREKYLAAVGKFIDSFAQIEAILINILVKLSGVTPQASKALFSGVRADAATQYISRILEATKAPKSDLEALKIAFEHLATITLLRNDLVHYGTKSYGPDTSYIVTNKRVALNRARLRETIVSARVLKNAEYDLQTIHTRLTLYYARGAPSENVAIEIFRPLAERAWRYKSALQAPQSRKRAPKSRKPRRQPKPSHQ